jgi:hypothetical protein
MLSYATRTTRRIVHSSPKADSILKDAFDFNMEVNLLFSSFHGFRVLCPPSPAGSEPQARSVRPFSSKGELLSLRSASDDHEKTEKESRRTS